MSSNTLWQSIDNQQEQLLSSQQHEAQLQLENSINSITTWIESTQAEQVMQLWKDALRELSNNWVDLNTLLSSNLTTWLNPLQAFLNNVSSQPKFLNLFSIALKETNPRHKHYDKAFWKMKSEIQLLVSKQIDKQHESESVFARTKLEKAKDDELKAQEKHDLEAYSPDKWEQISSAMWFASTEQMMQQVKSSPWFANYRQSYGSDQEMEAGILSFYRTQAQLSAKWVDDPFVNSFDKIKKDLQLPAAINASDISSMSELRDVNNATIMQSWLNNYAQISEAETNYNAIDRNSLDNDDALEMWAYHSLDDMTSSRDDIRTNMWLLW